MRLPLNAANLNRLGAPSPLDCLLSTPPHLKLISIHCCVPNAILAPADLILARVHRHRRAFLLYEHGLKSVGRSVRAAIRNNSSISDGRHDSSTRYGHVHLVRTDRRNLRRLGCSVGHGNRCHRRQHRRSRFELVARVFYQSAPVLAPFRTAALMPLHPQPYIDAHTLSIPTWRYAYILWFVVVGTLIVWSVAYHLSGASHGGSALGAWFRKFSIRRIAIRGKTKRKDAEGGKTVVVGRKSVRWASPTYAQMAVVVALIGVALCLSLIGPDYIAVSVTRYRCWTKADLVAE